MAQIDMDKTEVFIDGKFLDGAVITDMTYTYGEPIEVDGVHNGKEFEGIIGPSGKVYADYKPSFVDVTTFGSKSTTYMSTIDGSYVNFESGLNYSGATITHNKPEGWADFREKHKTWAPESPVDVIDMAVEAIEQLGWTKGVLSSKEGVCALGAISVACSINTGIGAKFEQDVRNAVKDAIQVITGERREDGQGGIPSFNDAEETSKEDVLLAFKHARHALETE